LGVIEIVLIFNQVVVDFGLAAGEVLHGRCFELPVLGLFSILHQENGWRTGHEQIG